MLWDSNWTVKDESVTLRQVMDEETSSGGIFCTSIVKEESDELTKNNTQDAMD